MLLGGLQKFTLLDFPGKTAAAVFTIGCNFACPYCHNSELVDPQKIKNQLPLAEADFFLFLKQRRGWLDGVCISGGEPTLQPDLAIFAEKIKNLGFLVKLDTNGGRPMILRNLIKKKLLDYVAMDIKAPLEKYAVFTDLPATDIEESAGMIRASGLDYEFRTTALPALHTQEDFLAIAQWLKGSRRYYLQQFRPEKTLDEKFLQERTFSNDELKAIRDSIRPYFEICDIR